MGVTEVHHHESCDTLLSTQLYRNAIKAHEFPISPLALYIYTFLRCAVLATATHDTTFRASTP